MRADLLRPILRWALWNWRHALLSLVAVCVVLAVFGRLVSGLAGSSHGARPASAARAAAAPAPQRPLTAAPETAPAAPAAPPPAALLAARDFAVAWVSGGPGWITRVRRYATPSLAAQLAAAGPAARALTGPLTVASQAPGAVAFTVPTDAGTASVTVRLSGASWRAAILNLAGMGGG